LPSAYVDVAASDQGQIRLNIRLKIGASVGRDGFASNFTLGTAAQQEFLR